MEKQEMLNRIEEHFGERPKYMGAPSFAYQIILGDEMYTINRAGEITDSKGREIELRQLLCISENTTSEAIEETQQEANITEAAPATDRMEVVLPMGDHTVYTLRNLINMIASKQGLIQKAFNLSQVIVHEEFIKAINENALAMFQDFEIIEHEIGTDKCPGISFDFDLKTITFKLYVGELEPDRLKAYMDLVALINTNAQKLKHASWKPTTSDNPKYSFRTWLLRLGMIGEEYKTTRKVLLANLEGNGAFRKGGTKDE